MTVATPRPLVYVYAVLGATRAPSLPSATEGLPEVGPPRLVSVAPGLWLVVADAAAARYGEARLRRGLADLDWVSACALAHAEVVERAAARGAVIPMRLFTLFGSEARALATFRRRVAPLTRLLARLAGRREWGVRARLDVQRASALARRQASRRVAARTPGTRFLLRRQGEGGWERTAGERLQREATRLFRDLKTYAADARRRVTVERQPGSRLVLDAVFLVPDRRTGRFRAAVRAWARRLAPVAGRVELTGPWPPYHFTATRAPMVPAGGGP